MFNKLLLTCLFPAIINLCTAQQLPEQWIRLFQAQGKASDRISAITTDASGNIYVAGYAGRHHGAADAFAMKRNAQGDTLWVYYYDEGGYDEDHATDIYVDNAGNCYITGHSTSSQTHLNECFTACILPSGAEAWITRYSPGSNLESYGNAITADDAGNVYVAGYTDPSLASSDWLVIKYNSSGIEQWADVFNGPDNGMDEAMDIVIAPNGNPTVCGYTYTLSATGGINAFIRQYNSNGGTVWTDTWSNPSFTGTDKAYGLEYISSGDLLVGGESANIGGFNLDAFALRYDSSGSRLWSCIFPDPVNPEDEYLRDIAVDDSGNVYLTGTDYQDGYVTRINHNGTPGWRKFWRGPLSNGNEVFHGIALDNSGGVYVTGRGVYPGDDYYGNGGKTNMIISKYNASGDSLWTYRCEDTLNCSMGFAITHRNGIIYAGGFTTDTAYVNENLYTIMLDQAGNKINEWIYNGIGDAITMGQFVTTDANDNVYCAATIDRIYNNGTDIAVVKYDPLGNLLWEKYFSSYGWNNDTLTAMQFDPSGDLILSVSTDSALLKDNYRLCLLRLDQNGAFVDTAYYGNTATGSLLNNSMDILNNGSIALAVSSSVLGGLVYFFDSSFNLIWQSEIDTAQFAITRANSVSFLPGGDLCVGGHSQNGSLNTGLVQRYDNLGTLLWTCVIDSSGVNDEIHDLSVDASGDIAYTGASGIFNSQTTIAGKINGVTGSILWQQTYNPSTAREHGVKVEFTPAGNVVLISRGWTGSVARYFTVQYSGSGVFLWARVYNQTASDREPVELLVEPDNRVVTAGWEINGFSTNYDYVLAGYDASGNTGFINNYTDTVLVSSSWDQLRHLARDSQGNFIVTGQCSQEFFNAFLFKMVTIKYGGAVVGTDDMDRKIRQSVIAYPNPSVNGLFTLLDASPFRTKAGNIYTVNGQLIGKADLQSNQVDLSDQPAGIYILEIERAGERSEYSRLVVY
jgi:hypothetical protein